MAGILEINEDGPGDNKWRAGLYGMAPPTRFKEVGEVYIFKGGHSTCKIGSK